MPCLEMQFALHALLAINALQLRLPQLLAQAQVLISIHLVVQLLALNAQLEILVLTHTALQSHALLATSQSLETKLAHYVKQVINAQQPQLPKLLAQAPHIPWEVPHLAQHAQQVMLALQEAVTQLLAQLAITLYLEVVLV